MRVLMKCTGMASGILAYSIAWSAGVGRTVTWHTTDTGDPKIVIQIMALEVYGPRLSTALLEVSYAVFKSQQFIHCLQLSCHGLFLLIISEWQLEFVVVMGTMQRDVRRGTPDTYSHMFKSSAKMERKGLPFDKYLHKKLQFTEM